MSFNYLFSVVFLFLRVVSFNARGLMDVEKFENMKEICRGVDVFVLQETNWKNDCVKRFENLWDGIYIVIIVQRKLGKELLF